MSEQHIIIKDPLYKQILFEAKHKKYLDSKEFQRLRNIKQTSFLDLVYPSANHTRFSHSLGVYHLMKKVLNNKLNKVDKKTKENLVLAGLLHDIGHGPFSHLWERVFPHFDHEKTTHEILLRMGLKDVVKVLQKKSKYSCLISSTVDMDKLDYMARDSYFAGVSYGVAEVDFILEHINVIDGKLVVSASSVSSVEDLITQRVNLFKSVYFHKFAMEFDTIFIKIFTRVRELLNQGEEVFMNDDLRAFFEKKNTIDNLLNLNDYIILYHIHEWANSKDKILKDFAGRMLKRKKFKVVNMAYTDVNLTKLRKEVAKKYDLKYYYTHVCIPINILQTPIYVDVKGKLRKLEEVSDLISFYKKQKWNAEFVIYPRDVKI